MSAPLEGNDLDYPALWDKARNQAERESQLMYPEHHGDLRRKFIDARTLELYRQMAHR